MKAKYFFAAILGCWYPLVYSQEKEVKIDTVFIFDQKLDSQKDFHQLKKISSVDIQKNNLNLSEVLRFQTPIYIKENGRGATSSPSFRGTTAQQTSFLWNGIAINSLFLGQGDINNIGFLLADEMVVKSGGGSVLYGSGAIGGSIHLNNSLTFDKGLRNEWYSEVASYGTFQNVLKSSYSNAKLSAQLRANHSISENDYQVEEQDYYNRNGKYSNGAINLALSYRFSPQHQLSWITEMYHGNQQFPIFSETQNRSHYATYNFKTLGIWDWKSRKINNHFRWAYTEDEFRYFQKKGEPQSSGGQSENIILKNDWEYSLMHNLALNISAEFQHNKAVGYLSGIDHVERNVFSGAALLRYQPIHQLEVEVGAKKDEVQDIVSPWLYSFSGKWKFDSRWVTAISFSRNYRYPSFNDLYFQPGGNQDLKAETSHQLEWKTQWKNRNFSIVLTPYYMDIQDMIRWLPTSDGYWKAFNTHRVESYGLETLLTFQEKWGKHSLKTTLGYTYTKSVNKDTQMQLMYVPYHKANAQVEYQYQKVKIYVQGLWNGKTYTDSMQKEADALLAYVVLNAGVEWPFTKYIIWGAKVNNLNNQEYATTAYYYMPKRNYGLTMRINF